MAFQVSSKIDQEDQDKGIQPGTNNASTPDHAVLQLQRTIGNQGVLRLFDAGQFGVVRADAPAFGVASVQLQGDVSEAANGTGMPCSLKAGMEALSGIDLSGVRVHSNSSEPAQLNTLAYTQGQDIHVAPGQEKHLPHEGWQVVQQIQGRVKPTMQAKGVTINDDPHLEREADVMGAKALQMKGAEQADDHLRTDTSRSDTNPGTKLPDCETARVLQLQDAGATAAPTFVMLSGRPPHGSSCVSCVWIWLGNQKRN